MLRQRLGLTDADPLPKCVWPGLYPVHYYTRDGLTICPDCANDPDVNPEQEPVDYDINYEDSALYCDDCGKRIESAYGEAEE